MPADYLDTNLAIGLVDPVTKEIKATPYFEDYLYNIISTLGGEGSTLVSDVEATSLGIDKVPYLAGLVNKLLKQVDEIGNTVNNPVINAIVKEISERTALFDTKVKSVNYTAINRDFVEARSNITIKLPGNPLPGNEVIVANGDGTRIRVDGNGNKIKYTTVADIFNILRNGSSKHFHWFNDNVTNERYWRAR